MQSQPVFYNPGGEYIALLAMSAKQITRIYGTLRHVCATAPPANCGS